MQRVKTAGSKATFLLIVAGPFASAQWKFRLGTQMIIATAYQIRFDGTVRVPEFWIECEESNGRVKGYVALDRCWLFLRLSSGRVALVLR